VDKSYPRLIIAALRGGAGKTVISVALAAALNRRKIALTPFKKGPDYIDSAWLAFASQQTCYNLDTFLMGAKQVLRSFAAHASANALSLIEGNRGLYDGVNADGDYSTAELAKLLRTPVILVVDCDKITRTTAALILGCCHLDPAVDIRGVILNRVSSRRHAGVIRQSIKDYCRLPVLGTVPRMNDLPFTERHLGLIPPQEHLSGKEALNRAAGIAEEYLDIEGLMRVAASAPPWPAEKVFPAAVRKKTGQEQVTIGVLKDSAFQFYYPDNLDALIKRGAKIVEINALEAQAMPDIDALYIGGGFPETSVQRLAANELFRSSLRKEAKKGLPIYAECGGFMYLGKSLTVGGKAYPMAGVLPVAFGMEKRPQGHGYMELEVDRENPFFPVGTRLKGHEFHYCRILSPGKKEDVYTAFHVLRGTGIGNQRDGMVRKNILAGFTHLHALGTPKWAEAMIVAGRRYNAEKSKKRIK
jgi:cobyrinic acid a,c-diamide synthase